MNYNWLKVYVVDIIPCITLVVYALGIIYNISFFSSFGIDVLHYITLGELLINVLEPLLITVLFVLLIFIGMSYCGLYTSDFVRAMNKREKPEKAGGPNVENLADGFVDMLLKYSFLRNKVYPLFKKLLGQSKTERRVRKYRKYELFVLTNFLCAIILLLSARDIDSYYAGLEKAFIKLLFLLLFFLPMAVSVIQSKGNIVDLPVSNYKTVELSASVFVIFLTVGFLFYNAGKESASYRKTHDDIKFTIKTTIGDKYDNHSYYLIEQLNEDIFLCDKHTEDIVVLCKSNLASIRINFNKKSGSLFESMLNNKEHH